MNDALRGISTRHTPQNVQAKPEQVRNQAGGYVFQVDPMTRVRRFLTLGVDGGTYYQDAPSLAQENAQVIIDMAANDPHALVDEIVAISSEGRAPKNNPALFALAVASASPDEAGRKYALANLPKVARTATHLFQFVNYARQFRGWGQTLKRAVGKWYTAPPPLTDEEHADFEARELNAAETEEEIAKISAKREAVHVNRLAYQMVKYRQREDLSQRDALRFGHPETADPRIRALFNWAANGNVGHSRAPGEKGEDGRYVPGELREVGATADDLPKIVHGFEKAKALDESQYGQLPGIIREYRLSWEMLPSGALSHDKHGPSVWRTLLDIGVPQTALMRQLPRLTRLGVIGQPLKPGDRTDQVVAQLTDPERLKKARVHPVNVLVANATYAQGHGMRGSSTWTPAAPITDAVDKAFYLAFGAVEPANKRTMLALDVSGSMSMSAGGTPLSCYGVETALALVTANVEPKTDIFGFTAGDQSRYGFGWNRMHGRSEPFTRLNISSNMRLTDAMDTVRRLGFGGTDCSLPMVHAAEEGMEVDTFIIMTDNQTWHGKIHPYQALNRYREKSGINARLAVVGMTAADFSIAEPSDPGSLDVAGFDSAVPNLLSDFSAGRL